MHPAAPHATASAMAQEHGTSLNVGLHPRAVLLGAQAHTGFLPVCDHYSGVETRMRKSLQLQAELTQEFGTCVMDVTLDCEDGAPAGAEVQHAALVASLARHAPSGARVAARVHAVDHPAFESDVATIVGEAADRLCHLMLPKVECLEDVQRAVEVVDRAGGIYVPLHALIESSAAVHHAFAIASHPRIQSLSFGLMDFVSSHGGAIPSMAMSSTGQFSHPLVVRAKLEIAAACHAHGKVPSHCVVTEFSDTAAMHKAASRAALEWGYTRMWSIHPAQVRPILQAFSPAQDEIDQAARIVVAAWQAQWAPISVDGVLHDRASYRFYWHVLERAHRTGRLLPDAVRGWLTVPQA